MTDAFFQHIARCLFEPLMICGLIGAILFLCLHWRKEKSETLLFGFVIAFLFGWRTLLPVNADRYALILIPVSIFFTVFLADEVGRFCKQYTRFPVRNFLLALLAAVCLAKAFRKDSGDIRFYEMIHLLKQKIRPLKIVSDRNISCFLGKDSEVTCVLISGPFRFSELPRADYYLLKLNKNKMPQDMNDPELSLLRKVRTSGKHDAAIYLWKRKSRKE